MKPRRAEAIILRKPCAGWMHPSLVSPFRPVVDGCGDSGSRSRQACRAGRSRSALRPDSQENRILDSSILPETLSPSEHETGGRTEGIFQNVYMQEGLVNRLAAAGFCVFTHSEIPAGDGGPSPGQAMLAAPRFPQK